MSKIINIDGDGIVYSVGFASQTKHKDGALELRCIDDVKMITYQVVNSILKEIDSNDYTIYLDGGSNFRHSVATLAQYKGNRSPDTRPHYYAYIRDYLIAKYNAQLVVGEEVDDRLGIEQMKNYYQSEDLEDCDSTIVTLDKDLDMIPGWHLNWKKKKMYFQGHTEGLRCFYTQLLTGDTSDNIPGLYKLLIKDKKDKEAKELKSSFYIKNVKKVLSGLDNDKEMYNTIENIYTKYGYSKDILIELGRLLWIRRSENELWFPPT